MISLIKVNNLINEQWFNAWTKKYSSYGMMINTLHEFFNKILLHYETSLTYIVFKIYKSLSWDIYILQQIQLLYLEFKNPIQAWRRIKNYPLHGQTTHTNSKMVRKNKILLTFRVNQFFQQFGVKKRNIYPTLIIAEYTNRMWCEIWLIEWLEARQFVLKLVKTKVRILYFDPVNLAKNITTGYTRKGAAAKVGKKKQKLNTATLGLPIFFSRYLYYENIPRGFPFKLALTDEDRRKMGRKSKKNLKKKK